VPVVKVRMHLADVLVQTCNVSRVHGRSVRAAEACGDAATEMAEADSARMSHAPSAQGSDPTAADMSEAAPYPTSTEVADPAASDMTHATSAEASSTAMPASAAATRQSRT
jgi:hypothetical protein